MEKFAKITSETLSTPQDRVDYHTFLNSSAKLSPIQKLFGTEIREKTHNEIDKQVLKLAKRIHPDRVSVEEQEFCTKLFQTVQTVQTEATKPASEFSSFANVNFQSGLFLCLDINGEKWRKAQETFLQMPGSLPHLGSLIHVKLGDLKKGLELLSDEYQPLKGLWTRCQVLLERYDNSPADQQALVVIEMVALLNEMNGLKNSTLFVEEISPKVIPYLLPLKIADWHALQPNGNPLVYEKYLREAIRYCPDGLTEIKQQLVDRLKAHVDSHQGAVFGDMCGIDFQVEMATRLQGSRQQIANGLVALGKMELANAVRNVQNPSQVIARLTQELQPNLGEKAEALFGSIPFLGDIVKNINKDDDREQLKREIERSVNELRGFESCIAKDRGTKKAIGYFLDADRPLLAGLIYFSRHQYFEAISIWTRSGDSESLNYIYRAMNHCDRLIVAEEANFVWKRLGPVDEAQLKAIQAHYVADV